MGEGSLEGGALGGEREVEPGRGSKGLSSDHEAGRVAGDKEELGVGMAHARQRGEQGKAQLRQAHVFGE